MLNVENAESFISYTALIPSEFRAQLGVGLQKNLEPSLLVIENGFTNLQTSGVISGRIADIGIRGKERVTSFLHNFISSDEVVVYEETALEDGAVPTPHIAMSDTKHEAALIFGSSHIEGKAAILVSELLTHVLNTALTPTKLIKQPEGHPSLSAEYEAIQQAAEKISSIAKTLNDPGVIDTSYSPTGIDIYINQSQAFPVRNEFPVFEHISAAQI